MATIILTMCKKCRETARLMAKGTPLEDFVQKVTEEYPVDIEEGCGDIEFSWSCEVCGADEGEPDYSFDDEQECYRCPGDEEGSALITWNYITMQWDHEGGPCLGYPEDKLSQMNTPLWECACGIEREMREECSSCGETYELGRDYDRTLQKLELELGNKEPRPPDLEPGKSGV